MQQPLRSLAELDAKLAECDAAERISDDAMRAVFETFRMDPPRQLPDDPFSETYRRYQLELYARIAGKPYSPANEVTAFDIDQLARRPFPWSTNSAQTVGNQLMGLGFLLKTLDLPPNSRILEFGPGWGNTTIALAKLGHHVTAVDIEPHFCELLRRRAAHEDVSVEVVQDDFMYAAKVTEPYDAVLFFDSFHHASDHLGLLRALHSAVKPEGRLMLGGLPIQPDFPMPWGLRMDGQSLWAIRKNGWLELGFRTAYFEEALKATGWKGSSSAAPHDSGMQIWQARPRQDAGLRFSAGDTRLATHVGRREDEAIVLKGADSGTGLYGPYVELAPGAWIGRLHLAPGSHRAGIAVMDIASEANTLAQRPLMLLQEGDVIDLPFSLDASTAQIELRMFCEAGCACTITAVEFVPQD